MRPLPIYNLLAQQSDVEDSQFIPTSTSGAVTWALTTLALGIARKWRRLRSHWLSARGGEYRYAVGKNHWKFDFTRGHFRL